MPEFANIGKRKNKVKNNLVIKVFCLSLHSQTTVL